MQITYRKILVIGAGGGREHAIGWKVAQSPRAGQIFFAPGNAGTVQIGTNVDIKSTDTKKLLNFAQKEQVDLVLVVSDEPVAVGVVDEFQKAKIRIWGPTRAASEIEWSKAYAKDFMKKYGIPTARYAIFSDYQRAKLYVDRQRYPVVIKASGLAFGKGVIIAKTNEEADQALKEILLDKIFGDSGNEVVIEEYLEGIEISIHVISDGRSWKIFPASQDHKRIHDGNLGPNTGGMGAIAPLPFMNSRIMETVEKEIVAPAIVGMAQEGRPFTGCLYPGIMLTDTGPKVFEFNARLGDPEAEVYMRLLETDILDIVDASIDKRLDKLEMRWKNLSACSVALASGGYPGTYEKSKEISGIEEAEMKDGIVVFHAGTKNSGGKIITNGGRVLWVSAVAENLEDALKNTYKAIEKISFEGMQWRTDIGKQALLISKEK